MIAFRSGNTPLSGMDLLTDLVVAVKKQYEQDGNKFTTQDATSSHQRRRVLTRKWRGQGIVARLSSEGSPVDITSGLYEKEEDTDHFEPVLFEAAVGRIKAVTPAYGGFIALTGGVDISLPRFTTGPIPAEELGLEIDLVEISR